MRKILTAIAAIIASTNTFAASINSLDQAGANELLQDKTMTSISSTLMEGKVIENPIAVYFSKDGKLKAKFAKSIPHSVQEDTGTWSVNSDGTLCATWDHWDKHKPVCVDIYKFNDAVIFLNHDTNKFDTLMLSSGIKSGDHVK